MDNLTNAELFALIIGGMYFLFWVGVFLASLPEKIRQWWNRCK